MLVYSAGDPVVSEMDEYKDVAAPAWGRKRRESSSGTDPEGPELQAEAESQPRPAKRARVATVHRGGSTSSTAGETGAEGRSPAAQAWYTSQAALAFRPHDASWEAQLAKLKQYKHKHGDCSVPRVWAEDPGLGGWVNRQRKGKKKLDRGEPSPGITAARVAKLDALGFAWELSAAAISKQLSKTSGRRDDAGWETRLAKLNAYKRWHGDCSVPRGWAEDPGLGSWVDNQRKGKKKLDRGEPSPGITAARVAQLDALGFVWDPPCRVCETDDAGWARWLTKLAQYKEGHGDCNVPQRWAEDPGLGSWVDNQRTHKKALDRGDPILNITAARVAKLDKLGFAWAPRPGPPRCRDPRAGVDAVQLLLVPPLVVDPAAEPRVLVPAPRHAMAVAVSVIVDAVPALAVPRGGGR
jgi:hypothetical protein